MTVVDPGVASEPPFGFTLVLWLGVFFAITFGMGVLFRRLSAPRTGPFAADDRSSPDREDVTLEEPGPDRS